MVAEPAQAAQSPSAPHVRLAMSRAADRRLGLLRVRRLLAVELGRKLAVEPEAMGPLGDEVIAVWVDAPDETHAFVQVRRMGRALARHTVNVGAESADLAARVVALEASDMIRVQASAKPPDRCAGCRPVQAEPVGRAGRFAVAAAGALRWLPHGESKLLGGALLQGEHRYGWLGQSLYGQWLTAPAGQAPSRWLEGGLGLAGIIPLRRASRLSLGLRAGLAAVSLLGPRPLSDWTATAAAHLAFEGSPAHGVWLGVGLEPGAVLRPIGDRVRGFSLGALVAISAEPK